MKKKIEILQKKKPIRTIYSAPYVAHTNPLFKSRNMLKINDLYNPQSLKQCRKFPYKLLQTKFQEFSLKLTKEIQGNATWKSHFSRKQHHKKFLPLHWTKASFDLTCTFHFTCTSHCSGVAYLLASGLSASKQLQERINCFTYLRYTVYFISFLNKFKKVAICLSGKNSLTSTVPLFSS